MAMRVPNGTIILYEIVMYKIYCTAYVYIMFTFFKGRIQLSIMSVLYTFIAVLTNVCITVEINTTTTTTINSPVNAMNLPVLSCHCAWL